MNRKKVALSLALTLFLCTGLVLLSSWRSPKSKKQITSDTTRKEPKKTESRYSRKSIITFDENGKPHEEVTEKFEGDPDLREFPADVEFNFPMPDFPDLDIAMPEMLPDFMMPPLDDGFFNMDTTQFGQFGLSDLFNGELDEMMRGLEALGPEMEAMREQFENLDLDMQLEGWDESMAERFSHLDPLSELDDHLNFDFDPNSKNWDESFSRTEDDSSWEDRIKNFETVAKEELVKDGYLKASDKIDSMSWSDDEIKFNGKAIKEEHQAKYRELRNKYLKRNPNRGRPE